jgi:hypothetical protein
VPHIGFAGAGALPAADLTVLEKSGGLGGRAATRRHGDLTYDYGANYVKAADDRVNELLTDTLDEDGLVDVREPIFTFDRTGEVSPGREPDEATWSYEQGLTQVATRLYGRTDAESHRRTRIETMRHDADGGPGRWSTTRGSTTVPSTPWC